MPLGLNEEFFFCFSMQRSTSKDSAFWVEMRPNLVSLEGVIVVLVNPCQKRFRFQVCQRGLHKKFRAYGLVSAEETSIFHPAWNFLGFPYAFLML